MLLHTYPEGDFGSITYRFSASFSDDDIRDMFLLRENESDRPDIVAMLSRYIGIEAPVIRPSIVNGIAKNGTFSPDFFSHPASTHESALLRKHEYQLEALLWRANYYAYEFVKKFYAGEFLRDNRRNQTFAFPLSTRNPMEKVFTEAPYMPPVLNDWTPSQAQAQNMQYVPVEPYRPKV